MTSMVASISALPDGGATRSGHRGVGGTDVAVKGVSHGDVVAAPDQVPGVHDSLALDVHLAAFLEHECVLDAFVDVSRHLNTSLDVGGLHPRRHVHPVAPHVIE